MTYPTYTGDQPYQLQPQARLGQPALAPGQMSHSQYLAQALQSMKAAPDIRSTTALGTNLAAEAVDDLDDARTKAQAGVAARNATIDQLNPSLQAVGIDPIQQVAQPQSLRDLISSAWNRFSGHAATP